MTASADTSESLERPVPALAIGRYRFRFRAQPAAGGDSPAEPSGYLGSAWRGAFGHALKQSVCVTGLRHCGECALLDSCAYPYLFEARTPRGAKKLSKYPHIPAPYVLEPADRYFDTGESALNLGCVLLGPANDRFSYVAHGLERAGNRGLTKRRIPLRLLDVQTSGAGLEAAQWMPLEDRRAAPSAACSFHGQPPEAPSLLRVRLISPLRIKRDGHFVGASDFGFRAFAAALLRRISLLVHFFGDAPFEPDFAGLLRRAEGVAVRSPELRWRDWARHSSRQKAMLQMGGLIGRFELAKEDIELFWPCLWLGQWTHVGKGCTLGLGRYVLEPVAGNCDEWPAPARL